MGVDRSFPEKVTCYGQVDSGKGWADGSQKCVLGVLTQQERVAERRAPRWAGQKCRLMAEG